MLAGQNGVPLIPVVHGWSEASVEAACEQIAELTDPSVVGLGGVVPWLWGNQCQRALAGGRDARRQGLRFVTIVRRAFPNACLHVFGAGGLTTMLLLFALGVDSVDSTSWRIKAGHGVIMLPGKGDRFATERGRGRIAVRADEMELLEACRCPVCDGLSLGQRLKELDGPCRVRFIHNVWTMVHEAQIIRQQISRGTFARFAQ